MLKQFGFLALIIFLTSACRAGGNPVNPDDPGSASATSSTSSSSSATPNSAPTISDISNQTTDEDTAKSVSFTIDDVDGALLCSSTYLSMSSSNTTVVPDANVSWSGTYPNCIATITPAADKNENDGIPTITIQITDGTLSASASFTLTITPASVPVTTDQSTVTAIAGNTYIVTITSGTAPYSASITSGSGSVSVSGTTITYGAPGYSGTDIIEVSDAASQTAIITVNRIWPLGVGENQVCAIVDGAAKCWGNDTYGQLGDNGVAYPRTPTRVQVDGLISSITSTVSGIWNSCALYNGAAICFGLASASYGTNGDGTSTPNRITPVQVTDLTAGVISISLYEYHGCAVHYGAAKCWGKNTNGQLGVATGDVNVRLSPVQVSGLTSDVLQVSTGANHSCALKNDGTIWCWGKNNVGQLGDNTQVQKETPVAVVNLPGGKTPTSISVGVNHSCAVMSDATLYCWGYNNAGQLGIGNWTTQLTPVQVHGVGDSGYLTNVQLVATGSFHSCALVNQTVKCWGGGSVGVLGRGSTTEATTPINTHTSSSDSTNLSDVVFVSVNDNNSCALLSDETIKCWGKNTEGAVGNGDGTYTTPVLYPTFVQSVP